MFLQNEIWFWFRVGQNIFLPSSKNVHRAALQTSGRIHSANAMNSIPQPRWRTNPVTNPKRNNMYMLLCRLNAFVSAALVIASPHASAVCENGVNFPDKDTFNDGRAFRGDCDDFRLQGEANCVLHGCAWKGSFEIFCVCKQIPKTPPYHRVFQALHAGQNTHTHSGAPRRCYRGPALVVASVRVCETTSLLLLRVTLLVHSWPSRSIRVHGPPRSVLYRVASALARPPPCTTAHHSCHPAALNVLQQTMSIPHHRATHVHSAQTGRNVPQPPTSFRDVIGRFPSSCDVTMAG